MTHSKKFKTVMTNNLTGMNDKVNANDQRTVCMIGEVLKLESEMRMIYDN